MNNRGINLDLVPTAVYGVIRIIHGRTAPVVLKSAEPKEISEVYDVYKNILSEYELLRDTLNAYHGKNILGIAGKYLALKYINSKISNVEHICDLLDVLKNGLVMFVPY